MSHEYFELSGISENSIWNENIGYSRNRTSNLENLTIMSVQGIKTGMAISIMYISQFIKMLLIMTRIKYALHGMYRVHWTYSHQDQQESEVGIMTCQIMYELYSIVPQG